MQAQELRIGNWVTINNDFWYDLKGIPMIVTRVKQENDLMFAESTGSVTVVMHKEDTYNQSYSQFDEFIDRIRLTPEWLERAWFEHILNNLEDFYAIDYDEGDFNFGLSEYMDNYHICGYNAAYRSIKYVHQLQNIYFALTGTELEIK